MRALINGLGCLATFIILGLLTFGYAIVYIWMLVSDFGLAQSVPTEYNTFWWGMLQGVYVVPSLFVSFFNDSIAIYQTPNNGGWYDSGFLLGVAICLGSFFGGASD